MRRPSSYSERRGWLIFGSFFVLIVAAQAYTVLVRHGVHRAGNPLLLWTIGDQRYHTSTGFWMMAVGVIWAAFLASCAEWLTRPLLNGKGSPGIR